MITSQYSIAKNEIHNLDIWLQYGAKYTYRVILDTGSTDGTWEKLQEYAKLDRMLIIEQKIFDEFRFDDAKNYALGMCPKSDFYLAPDMDEWFSENTLDELSIIFKENRQLNNINCDRLDIFSKYVHLGPSNGHPPFNKIHSSGYKWIHPVYEYLEYQGYNEQVMYSKDIFIIHNQKQTTNRNPLYIKIMETEYKNNPNNTWNLWYLLWYYGNIRDIRYKEIAKVFLENSDNIEWNAFVRNKMKEFK